MPIYKEENSRNVENKILRFGKRSVDTDLNDQAYGYKRNGAPQPFGFLFCLN